MATSASKLVAAIQNAVRQSIGIVTPSSVSDIRIHAVVQSIRGVHDPEFITEMCNDIGDPSICNFSNSRFKYVVVIRSITSSSFKNYHRINNHPHADLTSNDEVIQFSLCSFGYVYEVVGKSPEVRELGLNISSPLPRKTINHGKTCK